MNTLVNLRTPQLVKVHSGKVRESFRIDEKTRMIVATDRISSFDQVLKTPVPGKGAVLNGLAAFWFELTRDIVDNHLIRTIDPNISLVKEAIPIRIEMVVRAYLSGSMWRYYQKGKRRFSGNLVPDGLKKNQSFPELLLTPTTKEESDREISPKEMIDGGWLSEAHYVQMEQISRRLFERAQGYLASKNLILVDTKYEFGLIDDRIVLIDEIHTPDSSRFWQADDYQRDPDNATQLDKEFVRNYLLQNKKGDTYPEYLPEEVVAETMKRYQQIFELITGQSPIIEDTPIEPRIYRNLVKHGIMKDGYIAIIMGSAADLEHCKKMKEIIRKYDLMVDMRVMSAHKNGEDIIANIGDYHHSIEPGAVIAVAGLSNGLGGALAANLSIPVFNCPPFKDQVDMLVNLNSSLMMPSQTPVATVLKPDLAALVAIRSLNLSRLKAVLRQEIVAMKDKLREDDENVRHSESHITP